MNKRMRDLYIVLLNSHYSIVNGRIRYTNDNGNEIDSCWNGDFVGLVKR